MAGRSSRTQGALAPSAGASALERFGQGRLRPAAGLLALVLAAPAPAGAAAPSDGPSGRLELGGAVRTFRYEETSRSGEVLDRERGLLPAAELRAELDLGRWFAAAGGSLAAGTVGYEGRVQSSDPAVDGLTATTRTEAALEAAELEVGRWLGEGARLAPLVGIAARRWHRNILPGSVISRSGATLDVSGLDERYAWWELRAGGRLRVPVRGVAWTLDAALVQGLAPVLDVDWYGTPVTLRLAPRLGWRAGVAARLELSAPLYAVVELRAEGYRFGASRTDPTTWIHEPDSETFAASLGVRAGVRF